ncbi:uncharacterized protein LOC127864947 isoform X1 [Dreissena polymorpha]|uniref:uncharacterized protein LOC127864947 isoform X1 n=1 Tax=Dreissena polymorpha TaxID=45954 RepID=UPI0022654E0F|nr:uncharacterized protein LOC127864947 isoform X1 [Dreissena polymorpha]
MVNTGVVRCYSDGDASGGSSAQGGGLHRQAGHLAAPEHRGHRPTGEQLRTLGYIGSDLLRSVVVRRRFCKDFTDYMISLVTQAIRNRTPLHVPLTEESLQHIRLCAEFHGRTETLDVRANIFYHFNIPTLSIWRIMSDFPATKLSNCVMLYRVQIGILHFEYVWVFKKGSLNCPRQSDNRK